jgi:hypothetical protein
MRRRQRHAQSIVDAELARARRLPLGYIAEGVEDTSSEAIRAWAPAFENFIFTATLQGTTKLTVDQDMTDEFEEMAQAWPKVLERLKALCRAEFSDSRQIRLTRKRQGLFVRERSGGGQPA